MVLLIKTEEAEVHLDRIVTSLKELGEPHSRLDAAANLLAILDRVENKIARQESMEKHVGNHDTGKVFPPPLYDAVERYATEQATYLQVLADINEIRQSYLHAFSLMGIHVQDAA